MAPELCTGTPDPVWENNFAFVTKPGDYLPYQRVFRVRHMLNLEGIWNTPGTIFAYPVWGRYSQACGDHTHRTLSAMPASRKTGCKLAGDR